METNGKKLRQALEKEDFFLLPGIYDCLSAKMAEKAGFEAVFFSGGAYSLADMGRPDIGFSTRARCSTPWSASCPPSRYRS